MFEKKPLLKLHCITLYYRTTTKTTEKNALE